MLPRARNALREWQTALTLGVIASSLSFFFSPSHNVLPGPSLERYACPEENWVVGGAESSSLWLGQAEVRLCNRFPGIWRIWRNGRNEAKFLPWHSER